MSFSVNLVIKRPTGLRLIRIALVIALYVAITMTDASPIVAILAGFYALSESFEVEVERADSEKLL